MFLKAGEEAVKDKSLLHAEDQESSDEEEDDEGEGAVDMSSFKKKASTMSSKNSTNLGANFNQSSQMHNIHRTTSTRISKSNYSGIRNTSNNKVPFDITQLGNMKDKTKSRRNVGFMDTRLNDNAIKAVHQSSDISTGKNNSSVDIINLSLGEIELRQSKKFPWRAKSNKKIDNVLPVLDMDRSTVAPSLDSNAPLNQCHDLSSNYSQTDAMLQLANSRSNGIKGNMTTRKRVRGLNKNQSAAEVKQKGCLARVQIQLCGLFVKKMLISLRDIVSSALPILSMFVAVAVGAYWSHATPVSVDNTPGLDLTYDKYKDFESMIAVGSQGAEADKAMNHYKSILKTTKVEIKQVNTHVSHFNFIFYISTILWRYHIFIAVCLCVCVCLYVC